MGHARGVDGCQDQPAFGTGILRAHRQGQGRAGRNLHGQQEVHFPAGFVQQVGDAVGVFGDLAVTVGEGGQGRGLAQDDGALIGVLQRPHRDAAVDHILSLVAGVVPASAGIERIAAAGPNLATLVGLVEAGRLVLHVARRSGQVRSLNEPLLDRDAAAILIEKSQSVGLQRSIQSTADRERAALDHADAQAIAVALCPEAAEIDLMDVLARGRVRAENPGLAAGHDRALGVAQRPGQGRGRGIGQHGALGTPGLDAQLVEPDRAGRLLRGRGGAGESERQRDGRHGDRGFHARFLPSWRIMVARLRQLVSDNLTALSPVKWR